jgi:hypothetical protein
MQNAQDLRSMLPQIEAIPSQDVASPVMPVATYLQEAEDLNAWMQGDRPLLEAHGQPAGLLDGLPVRIGALREAESEWIAARYGREQAQADYLELAGQAFELYAQIVRHMRYAFRKEPTLVARLPNGTGWASDADRIQDLNNVAVMGRDHLDLLEAAGFDPALLDQLATLSDTVANQYAVARGEKASGRGSKILRDRAYTHLKELVDEVRAVARFLFWNDEARLQGYRSEYARKNRQRADGITAADGMDAAEDVGNALPVPADEPSAPRNASL